MKIGLIDVDGHHYPNLALMKLSAWHKAKGDTVEWWNDFVRCWNSTIKPADLDTYGWVANPWVWIIDFERITKEKADNG